MSRAALLHGDQGLLDEYNERVAEKLNATSSSTENKSTRTVGFMRGIQQMVADIAEYVPNDSYFGSHTSMGALFDAKRQFYRLISLLLSDLGLIFDIRCPSPPADCSRAADSANHWRGAKCKHQGVPVDCKRNAV